MTLDEYFDLQKKLMEILGTPQVDIEALRDSITLRDCIQGVISEAVEVSDLISTSLKPWKDAKPLDKAHLREEVVDILFLWMETCIILEMTPSDVEKIYREKHLNNLARFMVTYPSSEAANKAAKLTKALRNATTD